MRDPSAFGRTCGGDPNHEAVIARWRQAGAWQGKDHRGGNAGRFMPRIIALFLFVLLSVSSAHAAQCGGDFNGFLSAMARDAQAAGVSRSVIDQAFAGVTL